MKDLKNYIGNIKVKEGDLTLRPSKMKDVMPVYENMRITDMRECYMCGVDPMKALMISFKDDDAFGYTIEWDGKPIAMCGVTPHIYEKNIGQIWLLGTEDIEKVQYSFYKHSKKIMQMMLKSFDIVENYIPKTHVKSINWITWLGFQLDNYTYFHNEYEFFRFFHCNVEKNSFYNEESRPTMH
tara:strand:+ start:5616 stop:6164 length:549 start_codon:yes stop_codon:yes gene_type:complete